MNGNESIFIPGRLMLVWLRETQTQIHSGIKKWDREETVQLALSWEAGPCIVMLLKLGFWHFQFDRGLDWQKMFPYKGRESNLFCSSCPAPPLMWCAARVTSWCHATYAIELNSVVPGLKDSLLKVILRKCHLQKWAFDLCTYSLSQIYLYNVEFHSYADDTRFRLNCDNPMVITSPKLRLVSLILKAWSHKFKVQHWLAHAQATDLVVLYKAACAPQVVFLQFPQEALLLTLNTCKVNLLLIVFLLWCSVIVVHLSFVQETTAQKITTSQIWTSG